MASLRQEQLRLGHSNRIAAVNLEGQTPSPVDHHHQKDPNTHQLLWVILIGLIFALIIQSLSANLGVSTGKHLSELCKAEYPKYIKLCLCLLAEVANSMLHENGNIEMEKPHFK
ncbi:hypothetical protein JCGZ_12122 [Jatropha curcas]|uniref:Uncharacterized protein n=1 Tax=Jatropha curcas TaxID=180498 RepID=A0A067KKN8_JATCU|nr:hypothetical protein JCGZ_12122 [Jatropha curcas]